MGGRTWIQVRFTDVVSNLRDDVHRGRLGRGKERIAREQSYNSNLNKPTKFATSTRYLCWNQTAGKRQ